MTRPPELPPVPPHEIALNRLRKARLWLEPETAERFCTEVSSTVRQFIEIHFKLPATEQTTEEFFSNPKHDAQFSLEQKDELQRFSEQCDLAKFARWGLGMEEMEQLYGTANNLLKGRENPWGPAKIQTRNLSPPPDARISTALFFISDSGNFDPPLFARRIEKVGSIRYSHAQLAGKQIGRSKSRAGRWLVFLRTLALISLVLALARPRLGYGDMEIEASGIDIVLAVDISGSMQAMDFKMGSKRVNRLQVVKKVIGEFIEKREADRIGLVAFAGEPYLVSPLTLNHDWLNKNLERLKLGLITEEGTAIGSALIMSVNRLKGLQAKSKVVVLLTDGVNNMGAIQPVTAAEAAAALRVKVYTIAAGTRGTAPFPVKDVFGGPACKTYQPKWMSRP